MKKLFVAVALVMGVGTSVAFAGNMSTNVCAVASINEFKPVDVKDLPQVVQDAIKKDYADLLVKEAAVEEDEKAERLIKLFWLTRTMKSLPYITTKTVKN